MSSKLIYKTINLLKGKIEVYLETPHFNFNQLKQIHSTHITKSEEFYSLQPSDGFYIDINNKDKWCIKTADCLPILLQSQTQTIFLHAGWRGLSDGILKNEFIDQLNPCFAWIGPHIKTCCFEVSPEFKDYFDEKYFKWQLNRLYCDLTLFSIDQLKQMFPNIKVQVDPSCTSCDNNYHSYRKTKTESRNYFIFSED